MTPNREELLFQLALSKPSSKRAGWLDLECDGDAALRQRVDALLAAHDATGVIPAGDSVEEQLAPTMKLAEPVADEAVGQTLGRYKLLERVGEGGCGVVYVAEQTEPVRRRVALKVIKLGMDTKQVVARFEAERQALAMMDHPNIAKVLDAGTTEVGRPYFVMELVRGIRITDYCDQSNLSTKDRLDLFIKVCQAIQHAHQKGIIHRDIKPSNILVTLHDGVPVPKVIDFGIAKATEGRLTDATVYTQLHQFIGTPAYMSPEQAEMSGLDIDTRSDIYSLGVLLYELLAGSTPFDGKELMSGGIDAMRKTIREKEPQRPSTRLATLGADELTTKAKRRSADTAKLLHQLKGDLDWIVMKCLEKDRQRRYETANGLAADIARHLNNEPVLARPPSTVYRFQKAFRRNKLLFTAATAVVLALVLGLGFAAAGFHQAVRQRDRAELARGSEAAMRVEAQLAREQETVLRRQAQAREEAALMQSYASDMRQVERAVASSELSLARTLLEEQRPKSTGDRDLRGWEWRYYWEQCRGDSNQILMIAPGGINSLGFRADGHLLALSLGTDLEIWDWRKRSRVFHATNAHEPVFAKVGSRLAFLRRNASITNVTPILLDTQTWTETALPEVKGVGKVLGFDFGIQDRVLLLQYRSDSAGALDLRLHLAALDVTTGREVWRRDGVPIESDIPQRGLSEDGSTLALNQPGRQILVVNMEHGQDICRYQLPDQTLLRIGVSHDGSQIRTANVGYQSSIRLWNGRTGASEGQFDGMSGALTQMRFTPGDRYLMTSGRDSAIRVWDWQERRLVRSLMIGEEGVREMAVTPDNRTLATATGYTGKSAAYIRIWDLAAPAPVKGSRVLSVANSSGGMFRLPVFSADSHSLLGLDEDGVLKQWDVATYSVIRTWPLLRGNDSTVHVDAASERALALQPGGDLRLLDLRTGNLETNTLGDARFYRAWFVDGEKRLLTIRKSPGEGATRLNVPTVRTVEVWDLASRKLMESFVYTNLTRDNPMFGPAFLSKDRGVFAFDAVGGLGVKLLGETNAPMRLLTVSEGPGSTKSFHSFDMSRDRRWVAAAQSTGAVSLWDLRTGTHSFLSAKNRNSIVTLFFSPEGTRLMASETFGGALNLWDIASQRQVCALPGKEFSFGGALAPDGHAFASYNALGRLEIWTAPSFEEIAAEEAKVPPPSGDSEQGKTEAKQP